MARTSRNGAPAAPSFEAIDDIDIDGMFADDGDALFDGLDMDLVPMGADMTGNIDNTAAEAAAEAAAPSPVPSPAAEEPPKRRKTKRKPKSPILLDEDEELNEAPKKRRKSSKSGAMKKKGPKKDKDEPKGELTKSKSKIKGMGMPPPLARGASSGPSTPQGQVATAGRFGGRQNRGQFALPLSRATSDKQKIKSKSSSKAAGGEAAKGDKSKTKKGTPSGSAPEGPKVPPVFAPPVPQGSFCGLKPSNTIFYPFMPALPAEPSIKNRKQYPVIDRINSSFMGYINSTSVTKNVNGGTPVTETENVFRLMLDTLKDLNPSGQANAAIAQDDKKTAISNAIGALRHTVTGMEKTKLAGDLFSACSLLKRQFDFLQINLSNMERWCKENFSEADYNATYGSPEKKQKEVPVESLLSKFKKPLIKVKIKCSGFKEPKLSGPLFAFLPASVVPPGAGDSSKEKKPKKRKSSTSETSLLASAGPVHVVSVEKEVVIKTYPDLRPIRRRQLISDHIAHTAKELEAACITRTVARCQAIDRRHNELEKMVEEDEVLVIHTAAMWQYIEKAGYFSDFTEEALNDTLRSVWAPEIKSDVARDVPFVAQRANGRTQSEDKSKGSPKTQLVFDRLQSLLVEESSDSEEDKGDDDDDDEDDENLLHDNFDEHIEALSLPPRFIGPAFVDLAALTVHERAYLHLRGTGLCENQAFPVKCENQALPVKCENPPLPVKSDSPNVCESNVPEVNSSRGREITAEEEGVSEGSTVPNDTLEDIIERMSADLRDLNKVNNRRASFLENVARTRLATTSDAKTKNDEEVALIAKCQQLLKRSKDSKVKTSKPKAASKDEYALPW